MDLRSFLAEHIPFQSMPDDDLRRLADGATVHRFPADTVIADYADNVPDDVWMVFDGSVTLHASADDSVIDTVTAGGIFGYTPLLTGSGMEFTARTAAPSTLVRLPGEQVREQLAEPAGLAFSRPRRGPR